MSLSAWICAAASKFRKGYRIRIMDDIPEEVDSKTIFVVGDSNHPQYVVFLCPCGCGRRIELNLNPESSPRWKLKWHLLGTVSLSPSVWRKSGCWSHFFLKHSKVLWC